MISSVNNFNGTNCVRFSFQLDVIVADLDVGSLHVPAGVSVPRPEPGLLAALHTSLMHVLQVLG